MSEKTKKQRIRELTLEDNGLSPSAIATKVGTSQDYVYQVRSKMRAEGLELPEAKRGPPRGEPRGGPTRDEIVDAGDDGDDEGGEVDEQLAATDVRGVRFVQVEMTTPEPGQGVSREGREAEERAAGVRGGS